MIDFHLTIEQCLNKDNKAYTELYDSMYTTVYKTCMRYAPNRIIGQDYIQECFIKIFNNLNLFIGDTMADLGAWVKRICLNYCVDQARGLKPTFCEVTVLKNMEADDTEYEVEYDYSMHQVFDAIQKLTPRYKSIFNMFVLDGYTHEEISKELGLKPSVSKATLFRAKRKLKQILLKTT